MPPKRVGNGRVTAFGQFSINNRAFLELHRFRVGIYINSEQEEEFAGMTEAGPEVMIGIQAKRGMTYLNLSSLTHEELCALRELFLIAFANAQDICLERDRIAQEEHDAGNDSYTRLYRRLPELIIREGSKWPNYPRIRRGFEFIAQLAPSFTIREHFLRGPGQPVLKRDGNEIYASNGEQEAGSVQGLREVPRTPVDLDAVQGSEGG